MLRTKKILLLCSFLSMVAFLSCGDIVDPSIGINTKNFVIYEPFFREFDASRYGGSSLYECNIGDTIVLGCVFSLMNNVALYKEKIPETMRVTISTLHENVGQAILLKRGTLGSPDGLPVYYSINFVLNVTGNGSKYPAGILTISEWNYWTQELQTWESPYGVINVSPDGDIITAEIKHKNKTMKTSLKVIGETK